mgnify:CR=1 FL=1|jgi:peptidoglycan/LPS O-acetylase OafA/YrhL
MSEQRPDQPRSLAYIGALDGLRAVAILAVMGLHATWTLWAGGEPAEFLTAISQKQPRSGFEVGWAGVDLFFCLSGFLITAILLNRPADRGLGGFYRRRALRIVPLYAATLALAFWLGPSLPGALAHHPEGVEFWRFATLTHNFTQQPFASWLLTPSWSLGVEMHFYLLWPVLVLGIRRRRLGACFLAIVVLLPIAKAIAVTALPVEGLIYHVTPFRLDDFAAGALVAWALVHPDLVAPQTLLRACRWCSAAAPLGLLLLIVIDPVAPLLAVHQPLLAVAAFSLLAVGFGGWVGWAVLGLPPGLQRVLSHPIARWIGVRSYGLYLLHMLAFMGVSTLLYARGIDSPVLQLSLMFAAAAVLAALSWRLLERPFLRLKGKP